VRAGGDVEKDHFVSALFIVAHRQFNGITHVPQFARFGFAELDTTSDLACMDIQARYNAFGHHPWIWNRFTSSEATSSIFHLQCLARLFTMNTATTLLCE
jgi:hypothetical protein